MFSLSSLMALLQVVLIDITLAGDNAVVVGLAVRRLEASQRRIAVLTGVGAAAVIRLALAVVATKMLAIIGLRFAGGLLLLWVCWKMYRELRRPDVHDEDGAPAPGALRSAIIRIIVADLSMSLDNVLAVAGAAGEHIWVLVSGLAISVILMAVAATVIARLLDRYRWIAWVGLLVVLGVAIELIVGGGHEVLEHVT
ncbi:TerC family protein [Acetobacter oeni]|uniref:Membrane protein n=1 Tax=Acetobacter oeni TaxID=304077 RepID=A0A511XIM3_9PROT|nr:TerC family protein [Acetobacter oeni]MBB3881483.1 YjbE family integral membrane protein [Acetobacter oeni]NHO18348.1 YjbE family putative metal transport protein [Acetobacter oeni]GBR10855.1 integral membrane protein TerC [Acetobacter oeni LMG 21952]GEN62761.1 membrane protein [Acetobacter oeni]